MREFSPGTARETYRSPPASSPKSYQETNVSVFYVNLRRRRRARARDYYLCVVRQLPMSTDPILFVSSFCTQQGRLDVRDEPSHALVYRTEFSEKLILECLTRLCRPIIIGMKKNSSARRTCKQYIIVYGNKVLTHTTAHIESVPENVLRCQH